MTFEQFIEKVTGDVTLQQKMVGAKAPEEAYEIAKAAGLSVPYEEFLAAMKKLSDASSDISADEVDAIVGGAAATIDLATANISSMVVTGLPPAATASV